MLVYYSGFGEWYKIGFNEYEPVPVKIASRKNEQGIFELGEGNIIDIKYQKHTNALYLYPCYTHDDGVRFREYSQEDKIYFKLMGTFSEVKDDNFQFKGKVYTDKDIIPEQIPKDLTQQKKVHGNTETNAKKRKEILDAASSVLEKYPEQCKAKNGTIQGAKITKKIEEQSYEFWPEADPLEPPLGHDAIVRLVNKAIKDGIITLKNVE